MLRYALHQACIRSADISSLTSIRLQATFSQHAHMGGESRSHPKGPDRNEQSWPLRKTSRRVLSSNLYAPVAHGGGMCSEPLGDYSRAVVASSLPWMTLISLRSATLVDCLSTLLRPVYVRD